LNFPKYGGLQYDSVIHRAINAFNPGPKVVREGFVVQIVDLCM